MLRLSTLALGLAALALPVPAAAAPEILNASYDLSREFYGEFNPAFAAHYRKTSGSDVVVKLSNGGSSKQARAVLDGLKADVVTFNQATDVQLLVDGGLVGKDWRAKLPNNATPYYTLTVFIVRKGNPKGIRNWDDLAKPGIQNVATNPKTSGNGRYTFLGAAAFAKRKFAGDEKQVEEFLRAFYGNFPVLPTGGRDASTAFGERGVGDVLITFEAEARLLAAEKPDQYEVVVPPVTVAPDFPVAVVDSVAKARGTEKAARAYAEYLWSDVGQELAAKYHYRVSSPKVAARLSAGFPKAEIVDIGTVFGTWADVQKRYFAEDGLFDRLVAKAK